MTRWNRGASLVALLVAFLAGGYGVRICCCGADIEGECTLDLSLERDAPPTTTIDCELESASETWEIGIDLEFEKCVWDKAEFALDMDLGGFLAETELEFSKGKVPWKHWQTELEYEMDPFTFSAISKLSRTTDWLTLQLEREIQSQSLALRVRLRAPKNACSRVFYDARAVAEFLWCGAESELTLEWDDDGFDELTLELSDVVFSWLPWVVTDAEAVIDLDSWTFDIEPEVEFELPGPPTIEIEGEIIGFPRPTGVRKGEVVVSWDDEPWDVEATIRLDPNDWIDDAYWLEVETDWEAELPVGGDLSVAAVLDWADSSLARAELAVEFEPTSDLSLTLSGVYSLQERCLEKAGFVLEIDW